MQTEFMECNNHSVHNLLSSILPSQNIKINVYRNLPEVDTNSKNKNIRGLYRGINDITKG
jgi:hypothetical protein